MQHKTHKIAGVCSGLISATLVIPPPYNAELIIQIAVITIAAYFGGIAPDIDEPTSVMGRKVKPLSQFIKNHFGHRMITHTPVFIIGLILTLY